MSKKWLALVLCLLAFPAHADEKMAPYVLDGRLVVYGSSLEEIARVMRLLFQKFQGIEGDKSLGRWESALKQRMGVNILSPVEAESIGIDPKGSAAYVHLSEGKGYAVFSIKNKELLSYTLNNLPQPMPYRLLDGGRYVLFSASLEILDYQDFRGIAALPAFQTAAKALGFNWTQNFVWMSGAYLREKHTVSPGQYVFPDGDGVGMAVSLNETHATIDAYTVYKDPAVREALKKSMVPLNEQRLSLLDFESGRPAAVGQLYLHLPSYIESMVLIDRAEELGLRGLFERLESSDIDLKNRLFPYLKGRLSYVVRAYEPLRKILDITLTMGISDETRVREFLSMLVGSFEKRSVAVARKNLFTRDFYGYPTPYGTVWAGVAEGHLVVSTSEQSLNTLIKNIYEKNEGFLKTLPPSFGRAVKNKIYGGQTIFYINPFLQKVNPALLPALPGLLLPFETVEWYYYLQETDGFPGRRDTVTGTFFKGR